MTYKLSREALRDLEDIWLFTYRRWSKEQADRYYKLIFNEIEFISIRPDSGKDFGHFREGYRYTKVKSHLIFYRTHFDTLEVIRILHERMDLESRLSE